MRQGFREILSFGLAPRSVIPEHWILPLGLVAGVLLLAYLLNLLLKLRNRKLDSNARGCFGLVAIVIGTLLAVLIIGMAFRIRLLVVIVASVTLVPVVFLVPDVVRMILRDWRARRMKKR
jgi:hypothetical protein